MQTLCYKLCDVCREKNCSWNKQEGKENQWGKIHSLLSNKTCFFQRRYVGGDKKHHGENIFVVMYIENQGWMERGGGNGNEKVETYGHSHCAIGTQTYGYDADDPRDLRSQM